MVQSVPEESTPVAGDFTHYEDTSFVAPPTAPQVQDAVVRVTDPSPKSPSRSPDPCPDDAHYPSYAEDFHVQDFYWPDHYGVGFASFRSTLANYPMCLFKCAGEHDWDFKN